MLGLITARGGSQGIPQKNVRPVAGRPLIAWTIAAARGARRLARVVLSTDDPDIADVARRHGAEVPFMRPAALAGPDSPHVGVALHALQWLEEHEGYRPEYLVLLQPTSPLRAAADIDGAIELATAQRAPAVVSVEPAPSHPYLTYRVGPDGVLAEFVPCEIEYRRRQDLPPAFALNGALYVVQREVFLDRQTFLPPGTLAYEMPAERSLDVDTPWDLRLVDLILASEARP